MESNQSLLFILYMHKMIFFLCPLTRLHEGYLFFFFSSISLLYRQPDRHTNRQTDRQTGRQRQTGRRPRLGQVHLEVGGGGGGILFQVFRVKPSHNRSYKHQPVTKTDEHTKQHTTSKCTTRTHAQAPVHDLEVCHPPSC